MIKISKSGCLLGAGSPRARTSSLQELLSELTIFKDHSACFLDYLIDSEIIVIHIIIITGG